MMAILRTAIILIHPLLAICILYWMNKQYQYRNKRLELRGEVADNYRNQHEKSGRLLYRSALIVVTLGFISNFIIGYTVGDSYFSLLPSSLHGWFGIIGIVLLTFIVRIITRLTTNARKLYLDDWTMLAAVVSRC